MHLARALRDAPEFALCGFDLAVRGLELVRGLFGDAFEIRVYLCEVGCCVSDFGLEGELFGAGGEAGGEDLVFLRVKMKRGM